MLHAGDVRKPNSVQTVDKCDSAYDAGDTSNNADASTEKSIFVTVGTTSFDPLVQVSSSVEFCELIASLGYTKLTIQYGRGAYIPFSTLQSAIDERQPLVDSANVQCHSYRFKPSLHMDVQNATLIISHAGAGSIMEALYADKPQIVVINDQLMNNHQYELAYALEQRQYLLCCATPDMLLSNAGEVIRKISSSTVFDDSKDCAVSNDAGAKVKQQEQGKDNLERETFILRKFPRSDGGATFIELLDEQMGFS